MADDWRRQPSEWKPLRAWPPSVRFADAKTERILEQHLPPRPVTITLVQCRRSVHRRPVRRGRPVIIPIPKTIGAARRKVAAMERLLPIGTPEHLAELAKQRRRARVLPSSQSATPKWAVCKH
jgi:hypothetical protein